MTRHMLFGALGAAMVPVFFGCICTISGYGDCGWFSAIIMWALGGAFGGLVAWYVKPEEEEEE